MNQKAELSDYEKAKIKAEKLAKLKKMINDSGVKLPDSKLEDVVEDLINIV